MKKTKYNISFVLDGKDFELNDWTVGKHEQVLKEIAELKKKNEKISEKELDEKYRTILILKGLNEVDPNVTEDNLKNLHPDDMLALFSAVYLQGKRGILAEESNPFRKKKTKNTKSKTST